jgi:hypothetical protein
MPIDVHCQFFLARLAQLGHAYVCLSILFSRYNYLAYLLILFFCLLVCWATAFRDNQTYVARTAAP